MRVRPLRHNEAVLLRELRLKALADSPRELGPFLKQERAFPLSYWRAIAHDTQAADRRVCFVADDDEDLIGMVGADWDAPARRVHLVAMWVDPARRLNGIGAALVDAVADWACGRGADRVELWVIDGAPPAMALYRSRGFVDSGVRQPLPYSPQLTQRLLLRRLH